MKTITARGRGVRWSLVTQFRLGYGAALLMVLCVSGVAWWVALEYRRDIKSAYGTHLQTMAQLAEAESALWRLRYGFPQFMIGSSDEQRQILSEQHKWYTVIEERLAAYSDIAQDGEERRGLTGLRSSYERYKQARPKFFELWMAGEGDNAIVWRALTTTPFGAETVRAFDMQIALQRSLAASERALAEKDVQLALVLVTTITIVLLVMVVFGYTSSVRLLRPIRALRARADRVVIEQLGETIGPSTSSNELAALVRSFHLMSERLVARTESLRQSERRLVAFTGELEAKVTSRTGELALALEAATESDRLKSEFMANVTHELRTPLNSVIGFAELLKAEVSGPLNSAQAEFAADILTSGQRLFALVDGILEMSRLDAARGSLECEPVDIRSALEERVAAHRGAAEAQRVSIGLRVAEDVDCEELDPKVLHSILDALLDNSIKFSREGESVTVSACRAGGALEIAVADTGIGMAHEDLGTLFKPFVQLDAGRARRHGGVGMGLALARRLAELHGGTIGVESELGKGSTFTLRLPTGGKR